MNEVDQLIADAVESARAAAVEVAEDFGVGEYLGTRPEEGVRLATHYFSCPHPGYQGWYWAVTMARASRARYATVNEVVLLPGAESLLAPAWVPWVDRLRPGDLAPGTLLPTPDNDPRLEPGYTGGELAPDADPAEWALTRAIVTELGLGRQRVPTAVAGQPSAGCPAPVGLIPRRRGRLRGTAPAAPISSGSVGHWAVYSGSARTSTLRPMAGWWRSTMAVVGTPMWWPTNVASGCPSRCWTP